MCAVRGSADVPFLLVDGYDMLQSNITQLNDKLSALTEQTLGLGDAWDEHAFTGVRMAELSQDGFYDDAALSIDAALASGPGNSTRVLCYGLEGTATGAKFIGMVGVQVDFEVSPSRGVLTKAKATYKANIREKGTILSTWKASAGTSAETGNAVQRRVIGALGADVVSTVSSSAGGVGYMQLSAFTGAVNATGVRARIQHSSDAITWADLITFTVATAAPFAQRVQLGATIGVEAYLRMNTSFQGGASAQMTGMWGFVRY